METIPLSLVNDSQLSPKARPGFTTTAQYPHWQNLLPVNQETKRHIARVALDFIGAVFAPRGWTTEYTRPRPPHYGAYSAMLGFGDEHIMSVAIGRIPSGPDAYSPARNIIAAADPRMAKQAG